MANLDEEPEAELNGFDPENVHAATLITLLQIREILAGILQGVNPQGYTQVREAHSKGELLLEPPFLLPPGERGVK